MKKIFKIIKMSFFLIIFQNHFVFADFSNNIPEQLIDAKILLQVDYSATNTEWDIQEISNFYEDDSIYNGYVIFERDLSEYNPASYDNHDFGEIPSGINLIFAFGENKQVFIGTTSDTPNCYLTISSMTSINQPWSCNNHFNYDDYQNIYNNGYKPNIVPNIKFTTLYSIQLQEYLNLSENNIINNQLSNVDLVIKPDARLRNNTGSNIVSIFSTIQTFWMNDTPAYELPEYMQEILNAWWPEGNIDDEGTGSWQFDFNVHNIGLEWYSELYVYGDVGTTQLIYWDGSEKLIHENYGGKLLREFINNDPPNTIKLELTNLWSGCINYVCLTFSGDDVEFFNIVESPEVGETPNPKKIIFPIGWTPSEQPLLKAPWKDTAKITQGNHGSTSHYDHGTWDNTYAIDVALPIGSNVLSPADGVVNWYDDDPGGSGGRELAIEHTGLTGKKYTTVYLHLSEIIAKSGLVKQGTVVAKSGQSGNVTGPHLHFHIWSGEGSRDSHTIPIERLLVKQAEVDPEFREYDARTGDLDDDKISGKYFESNNAITNVTEYSIPLNIGNWEKISSGNLEEIEDTLRVYGSSYRVGGSIQNKGFFNFENSDVYIKWRINGNNTYCDVSLGVGGLGQGTGLTIDHSYSGSLLINPDEWYYTHFKIKPDNTYSVGISNGNYDDNSGNLIHSYSGPIDSTRWENTIKQGKIITKFGDNYGGEYCYLDLSEAKLINAIEINYNSISESFYNFEDGNIPIEFTVLNGNWAVVNIGYNSQNSLYTNSSPLEKSSISLSVSNSSKVAFDVRYYSGYTWNPTKGSAFSIDSIPIIDFDRSNIDCWHHFEWLLPDTSFHILKWYINQISSYPQNNAELWIDNITIFKPIYNSISEKSDLKIYSYQIYQNYPNPFNPVTTIRYELPKKSNVKITIYNMSGQVVEVLVNNVEDAGYHTVKWNASDVSSGVYLYRIITDDYVKTKKCIYLK